MEALQAVAEAAVLAARRKVRLLADEPLKRHFPCQPTVVS